MEEATKDTPMEMCIKETFSLARLTVKASTTGKTQMKFMMENGLRVSAMAMGFGRDSAKKILQPLEIPTLESGDTAKLRAMEFISGLMEIDTKENG